MPPNHPPAGQLQYTVAFDQASPAAVFDLSGKVAVVTGGATHLGRAMATAMAAAGATVYLAARDLARCQTVARELTDAGATAFGRRCDIGDPSQIDALVDGVVSEQGRIDVIVCNAAARSKGPFLDLATDFIRQNFEVNILGTAQCARAAARHMIPARTGSIVLIGSIHGALGSDRRTYSPNFRGSAADYHIAKGAIINMARALATEWSVHGVRVNCLSPGQIPTSASPADQMEYFRAAIPLGILGHAGDLMGPILLLASDAGRFITGQNLIVDGGWSAW